MSEPAFQSALVPASPQAEGIAELGWAMFLAGGATLLLVAVLVVLAVLRGRRARTSAELDRVQSRNLVLLGGVALPALAGFALLIASLRLMGDMPGAEVPEGAQRIAVSGRLWWWEVRYLDARGELIATTANEIHVPVGRAVHFLLASDNVIHSFWVPNLHGKIDLIPGRVNHLSFVAREVGVFRGQCAEFCGVQHAKMGLVVVAQPQAEFAAWLAHQAAPAAPPRNAAAELGRAVFLGSSCVTCHTIRGTPAAGELGPDLTHLASRLTLAAGTLPNTRGHLAGWIAGPQHVKPGSLMPGVPLEPTALRALLDYLETLE